MGTSVAIPGKNGRQPKRLNTFRFTVPTQALAEVVAALFGGHVAPWETKRGYWEVITEVDAIKVYVPIRGEAADSFMELWDGPVRKRQCDGETELLSGEPCQCPRDRDERNRLAKMRPPRACKPLTRIRVMIPQLPGLTGVFQLNTGSENALVEVEDTSRSLEIAREDGVYLPAVLRIEWRKRAADGSPYQVPVLQVGVSYQDLAQHALPGNTEAGLLTQLRAATPERKAISAGPGAEGDEPTQPPVTPAPAVPVTEEVSRLAQRIADDAGHATSQPAVRALIEEAKTASVLGVEVWFSEARITLKEALTEAWEAARPAGRTQ
jgi:hypothetical protein